MATLAIGVALAGVILTGRGMRGEIDGLRTELQSQIETSRTDLNMFRQEMREALSGMNGRLGAVERGQAELRERMLGACPSNG